MARVLMYTTTTCPYCSQAKGLLRSKGVVWEEINLDDDPERRDEMIERSGRRTVPQIWIGETHVGGCDDLFALEHAGELNSMLDASKARGRPDAEHTSVLIIGSEVWPEYPLNRPA